MIIKDVVCPFCGCLCDDIDVEVEVQKVIKVQNGCALAESKFTSTGRLPAPIRRTGTGWEEVSYEDAIKETAEILLGADRPLLYGWSSTHGDAQSIGVHIGELIGGVWKRSCQSGPTSGFATL